MNNPVVKLGIVLVAILGGGWFAMRSWKAKSTEYEHRLDLERVRREFLERAPIAQAAADLDRYGEERRGLFKWYFNELTDHYNKFSAFKNYDRFMDELSERRQNRKIKDQEFAQYEDRYKLTKELWDLMQTGQYTPAFTAGDKSLRFDIYKVQTVPGGSEPLLRLHFALYGAQRKWNVDNAQGPRVLRLNVSASFHEFVLKGFDEADKPIREMQASGDPFKIDNPERFIEEFPPGVVLGYYDIPKIPNEVAKAEVTFNISTRSLFTGQEVPGSFVWKMAPVDREWKLPPGSGWDNAQERVREDAEPAKAKR